MKVKKLLLATGITVMSSFMTVTSYAGVWQKDNQAWWYQNDNGSYSMSQWMIDGDKWYYFDENGYMAADRWVGNYYLGSDGAMLVNTTTPDGYKVGANGAWIQEEEKNAVNDILKYLGSDYSDYKKHNYVIEFSNSSKLVDKGDYYITTDCVLKDYMKLSYDSEHVVKSGVDIYWRKDCTIHWISGSVGEDGVENSSWEEEYNRSLAESWEYMKHLTISSDSNCLQDSNEYLTYVKFDNRAG